MNEEELARLDELARRMNRTRSDVIRDLISRFDEVLKEEVEKERKKWTAIGIVTALESAIVDPGLILRFIRRNVDILGFPDFLIGMVRVRNRVVLFSHHDRTGSQLLQLIRSRIEEEIRREEDEIEREEGEDEEVSVGRAAQMHISANRPARPNTIRVAPVAIRYKLISSNKAIPPTVKPTAISTVGKSVVSGGGGNAKPAGTATVPKNQKAGNTGIPTIRNSATTQAEGPSPQVNTNAGGVDLAGPNGQAPTDRPVGDFAFALVVNLYHKRRESLLRFIEALGGDPSAMAD
jgi:hypothetical protein